MLTEQQRRFCEGVISGLSGAEAYRRAYPGNRSRSVASDAAKLRRKAEVVEELARLRKLAADAGGAAVLSLLEKRMFLARVVRAQVANLPEDSDLWQSIKRMREGAEFRLSDKLAALKLDHELAGEAEENAGEVDELAELLESVRE